MLTTAWLRKDMPARLLKDAWIKAKDMPLPMSEGGSCAPLDKEAFAAGVGRLKEEGGELVGLACLTHLSNELSLDGMKVDSTRIEHLGRQLFATRVGPFADTVPGKGRFRNSELSFRDSVSWAQGLRFQNLLWLSSQIS